MAGVSEAGRPGRYTRSTNGLLAAMVITVFAVVAFVGFRGLFSRDLEVEPERIEYLETVEALQDGDVLVVYPGTLPEGWIATNVVVEPGDQSAFGLSLRTEDGAFVGIRQESEPVDDLLAFYLDEDQVDEEAAYDATGSVAPTWEGYSDPGGDVGYAAEVGDDTVLVYGSASAEDVQAIVDSLTDEPVATPMPSPSR
jgi:hypothetical protein